MIYRQLPASAYLLTREIEVTLLKYEPRLKSIGITIDKTESGMLISFLIEPRGVVPALRFFPANRFSGEGEANGAGEIALPREFSPRRQR